MAKDLIWGTAQCTAAKGANGKLSGFTRADNHAGLALALDGDNDDEVNPEPHVKKTAAAADQIVGILYGITDGTEKLTMITDGIVRVRKATATASSDIGAGIVGAADGTVETIASTATEVKGKGVVIGREDPNATEAWLWVDLRGSPTLTT